VGEQGFWIYSKPLFKKINTTIKIESICRNIEVFFAPDFNAVIFALGRDSRTKAGAVIINYYLKKITCHATTPG
jgi:hypothetical protein